MQTLKLQSSLFSEDLVEETIRAYEDLAEITLSEEGEYLVCSFSESRFDLAVTVCEFENYLIDLTNSRL